MKVNIKSPEEIEIMAEAGKKLHVVRENLKRDVKRGANALEIERLANKYIKEQGAESAFKKVPGYSWSTCINMNDGVVHGIPKKEMIFNDGDIVSVDVGLFYKGFYSDTSFSKVIGKHKDKNKFLEIGRQSLNAAIKQAKAGRKVEDISREMERVLKENDLEPIRSLTGHGIGRELHETPLVPCYVSGSADEKITLKEGMVLAIEVMYTEGKPGIKLDRDGWTLSTRDGKMSALFEETVAVTKNGPKILT